MLNAQEGNRVRITLHADDTVSLHLATNDTDPARTAPEQQAHPTLARNPMCDTLPEPPTAPPSGTTGIKTVADSRLYRGKALSMQACDLHLCIYAANAPRAGLARLVARIVPDGSWAGRAGDGIPPKRRDGAGFGGVWEWGGVGGRVCPAKGSVVGGLGCLGGGSGAGGVVAVPAAGVFTGAVVMGCQGGVEGSS